jgi:hypothetical protein
MAHVFPAAGLGAPSFPAADADADAWECLADGLAKVSPMPEAVPPCPSDEGIPAGPGDDTSPVNSIRPGKLNGLATLAVANIGFSTSSGRKKVFPSSTGYEITVTDERGGYGMLLALTLEFENPHPGQSMIVSLRKVKQMLYEPGEGEAPEASELALVSTTFQDWVSGSWLDITTDIRYTETAEAVADAVMSQDVQQTAGTLKQTGDTETARLGPVGEKGRIVLRYRCDRLYSVKEMMVGDDGGGAAAASKGAEERDMVPMAIHLPFSSPVERFSDIISNLAGGSGDGHCGGSSCASAAAGAVRIRVAAPAGTRLLETARGPNAAALLDLCHRQPQLQRSAVLLPAATAFASVPGAADGQVALDQAWPCAPPRAACLLLWLSVPTVGEDYVTDFLGDESEDGQKGGGPTAAGAGSGTQTVVHVPAPSELPFFRVSMPGGQEAVLLSATTTTRQCALPEKVARLHTTVTISDASGSTGMTARSTGGGGGGRGDGETVRARFNALAVRRFLNHLRAIPIMTQAQQQQQQTQPVFRQQDLICEAVYIFDSGVRQKEHIFLRVADLDRSTVDALMTVFATDVPCGSDIRQTVIEPATAALQRDGKGHVLEAVKKYIDTVSGVKPGGATSFVPPCEALVSDYVRHFEQQAKTLLAPGMDLRQTTFVHFDTDGGHNYGGDCYGAVRKMVQECGPVVGGMVTGVGSWVDQHCATAVARILRGPCILSLSFPDIAGSGGSGGGDTLSHHCRRDLSCWIRAARTVPIQVSLGAGATNWRASHGVRAEDAIEVIGASVSPEIAASGAANMPSFGPPDVSDVSSTRAVIKGINAGDSFTTFMLCRVPPQQLLPTTLASVSSGLAVICNPGDDTAAAADDDDDGGGGGGGLYPAGMVGTVELETLAEGSGLMLAHRMLKLLGSGSSAFSANRAVLVDRLRHRIEDDLSFQWNLALPGGGTAYLGRAKTESRALVPKDRQPEEPELSIDLERKKQRGRPVPCGFFDARPVPCGIPDCARAGLGIGKGGRGRGGKGWGGGGGGGASKRRQSAEREIQASPSAHAFASFGARSFGGGGGGAVKKKSPASSGCFGGFGATGGFGGFGLAAAKPAAPSFGFSSYSPTSPSYSAASPSGGGSFGFGGFGSAGSESDLVSFKCALPEQVLQHSDYLRMSTVGQTPPTQTTNNWSINDFGRQLQLAVAAAATTSHGSGGDSTGAALAQPEEDPMVVTVLGVASPPAAPASAARGAAADATSASAAAHQQQQQQQEGALLRSMVSLLQSWWMLMLAKPPAGGVLTAKQATMVATQQAQLKAQLPLATQLSQLMASITAVCASMPTGLVSGPAPFSPTRCALDKMWCGSAGDGEEDMTKPRCKLGHLMVVSSYQLGAYSAGWGCDACNMGHGSVTNKPGTWRWMCMACLNTKGDGTDYCFSCHPRGRGSCQ